MRKKAQDQHTHSRRRRLRDFPNLIITLDQPLDPRNRKFGFHYDPLRFTGRWLIAVEIKFVLLAGFWPCGGNPMWHIRLLRSV